MDTVSNDFLNMYLCSYRLAQLFVSSSYQRGVLVQRTTVGKDSQWREQVSTGNTVTDGTPTAQQVFRTVSKHKTVQRPTKWIACMLRSDTRKILKVFVLCNQAICFNKSRKFCTYDESSTVHVLTVLWMSHSFLVPSLEWCGVLASTVQRVYMSMCSVTRCWEVPSMAW